MRFLFVDRILELTDTTVVGLKHVTAEDYYLTRDHLNQPCFMPSLIGETLGQLAAWHVMFHRDFTVRPVAGIVARAKMLRYAHIGQTLYLKSFIECLDEVSVQYQSIAYINEEEVFKVEGALGPLLPMEQFIDKETVRRQFEEIYRPGAKPVMTHSISEQQGMAITRSFDFDTIVAHSERDIHAQKHITRAAPYFADHFPRKPVLPMTVLIESTLNLAKQFLKQLEPSATFILEEIRRIKMNEFVMPGDVVSCVLTRKESSETSILLSARHEVEGKRIAILEMVMNRI